MVVQDAGENCAGATKGKRDVRHHKAKPSRISRGFHTWVRRILVPSLIAVGKPEVLLPSGESCGDVAY